MERWKHIVLVGMAAFGVCLVGGMRAEAAVPVDEANFPDSTIRAYVKTYDKDNDGMLSDEELQTPTRFGGFGLSDKPDVIINFKGMENFPNIKELDLYQLGKNKENWNYGGSDLLQCFPYAEKISISGDPIGRGEVGQVTLSGTSDCLKEVRIGGDEYSDNLKVIWNVKAKNLKYVNVRVHEIDDMKNDEGELSSLESLTLSCDRMQNCNLAFSKMPLLKNLSLHAYGVSYGGEMTQEVLRDNGVFPEELSRTKLETLSYRADMQDYGFLSGLIYLKKLEISGDLRNRRLSLLGLSSLEELQLAGAKCSELDLKPVKKTLKILYVGSQYALVSPDTCGISGDRGLKCLDISQMECLEELYGCHTDIERIITRDASGKSALKKLRKLYLWHTKATSIRLEDMPALEELYLSGEYSKLSFTKCKGLKTLFLESSKLKSLNLQKNTKLDYLYIKGMKKVKKLDLKRNVKLRLFELKGTKITNLDLSKNTLLRSLGFDSPMKLKKLTLPALKNPKISMTNFHKRCKVDVLDISRIKKMDTKTRGKYLHAFQFKKGYKKVIISRKVKKSDRNWFKKKAKKVSAKVIVK